MNFACELRRDDDETTETREIREKERWGVGNIKERGEKLPTTPPQTQLSSTAPDDQCVAPKWLSTFDTS